MASIVIKDNLESPPHSPPGSRRASLIDPVVSFPSSSMLFTRQTQAIIYNFKENAVQGMLDFDTLCSRETPSVAALVAPGQEGFHKVFFKTSELLLNVYPTVSAAVRSHPKASVFINFASFRSAYASSMKALEEPSIKVVVIIAEGVPENQARSLLAAAKKAGKTIIGPATVGGIQAGAFKIANTAGTMDNVLACKLYRPGSVGFVSKSGGLSNEMYNVLSRTTDGIFEGIAIGGDAFPGSTILDHVLRFETLPQVKIIVVLGEIGGWDEWEIARALKTGLIKKPLCAWVSGTVAKIFPSEVQFGHAGAKSGDQSESADAKNKALREAGAVVPQSFEQFASAIAETYQKLVENGTIIPQPEPQVPSLPLDFKAGVKLGKVRKATNVISTICNDKGEEPTYCGMPISDVIEQGFGMGDVIGLLWFKRRLPKYASRFIEMCLIMVADHGPCVSGAHNAIVAARAGKDLVSSLASGLLTIGPRFGGAIDDAARYFKEAVDSKLTPSAFVEGMKAQGKRIPGIGHLIKNRENPDKRVVLLKEYAKGNFAVSKYLDYALAVEQYTLQKASNLILNVDGCIAVCFLDLLYSCRQTEVNDTDSLLQGVSEVLSGNQKKEKEDKEKSPLEGQSNGDSVHKSSSIDNIKSPRTANGGSDTVVKSKSRDNLQTSAKYEVEDSKRMFSEAMIKEIVDIGYLNGLFVMGRSIGLVGHVLDQKRLKQPLYRHPWEDTLLVDEYSL
eukprot:TRINITY_DN3561_c0_g1_i2.p1 TRINITY_DN3561_c0_g1~~TRINITY_DN3561_c0_g1_i2.p1  ORF type:complete len:732 (-),score=144.82 TRINITY_DN3561_c0_g1_i2:8-2203(-)